MFLFMRAAESRRTNDLGDSDFPDSFFRNDDLPPGRIHHGWHFGEIGRLFIPVITLKSVTGLTLGKTLLAIDRTFAGGLEGNFTIFMAVRANRFMQDPFPAFLRMTLARVHFAGTLHRIRLPKRMGWDERLRDRLRLLPPLERPDRRLVDQQIRFLLQGLEPLGNLHHDTHKLRKFGSR